MQVYFINLNSAKMKKMRLFLFLILFLGLMACSTKQEASSYLVAGSGMRSIFEVNAEGAILWEHALSSGEECNAAMFVAEDQVLYAYATGAKIVNRDHEVMWQYDAMPNSEVQHASVLKNGHILVGQCGHPASLKEFDLSGQLLNEICFDLDIKNPHAQFRKISETSRGTFIVPVLGKSVVLELDRQGKVLRTIKSAKGNHFSTIELKNGNWLISCGDAHTLLEVDIEKDEVVWSLGAKELEGLPLHFVATVVERDNGNLVICNWDGHVKGEGERGAKLFEINKDKEIIWILPEHERVKKVSTVDIR